MPLQRFVRGGVDPRQITKPFVLRSTGALSLSISDVRIASATVPMNRCGQP